MDRPLSINPISALQSTGGAIPVRNEKGEISMQKVKVQRYVAGKRPKYAPSSDNEEDEDDDDDDRGRGGGATESDDDDDDPRNRGNYRTKSQSTNAASVAAALNNNAANDRRLKRLNEIDKNDEETITNQTRERLNRHRHVAEPVILQEEEDDESENERTTRKEGDDDEEEEIEVDEEERARKRLELKKRALLQRNDELLNKAGGGGKSDSDEDDENSGEDSDEDESDSDDSEEDSDEDEDMSAPRLKPVFVRKNDRVTIKEKAIQAEKEKQVEKERERLRVEAKRQTKKYIEAEIAKEKIAEKESDDNIVCDFNTDDENNNNQVEYEAWKLRELKRIKRDRDEKEAIEKEKQEIQRMRNMTEEERLAFLKANPKIITNENKNKGKYKFLQKYYHRGAFFMDEEEDVLKRNFAEPTLEDHFDKTILPKVMQVKNFGMSGRTKYTHLLDQDTTRADDNPWANQEKFISGKGGGTKQVFDKPTTSKKK